MIRSLVHVSDLHFSATTGITPALNALCEAIEESDIDHVVLTGDVTDRGKKVEFGVFLACFGRLLDANRLTLVPGNHDRLGDDLLPWMMPGARVQVRVQPGLYMVRVDSTGPHNRNLLAGHGILTEEDLDAIDDALDEAPEGMLRVLMLHHHPLPLPEENLPERVSNWLGWPYAAELEVGARLLVRVSGRVDVILHGHRHVPNVAELPEAPSRRPLSVFNAGSTPALGRARVFTHRDGEMLGPPGWLEFEPPTLAPIVQPLLVTAAPAW
jgi:3',5'-cyclic AMP phosphodiesterase CpdA